MFLSKRRSSRIYYLNVEDSLGELHRISTRCKLKSDALKFLRDFKEEEHEQKSKLQRISLSQFATAYLDYSKGVHTPRTRENNETALNEFQRVVGELPLHKGELPLHKIGVREIEAFLATKKAEASEWTARNYYIALASAFETAKRWGHVLSNPFREVAKPKVPELEPLFFSRADFTTLMKQIRDREFRELVVTAVSTGMRQGELLALRWDWLDFSRKVITVKNTEDFTTKNKRSRVVPMTEALGRLMLQRRVDRTSEVALVFHRNGGKLSRDYVSKTFKRHVMNAGLNERYHFHSLRHTFASWLALDGVSLYAIQKLLGHSTPSVTQIYSHLQPEQLHSTVNRISLSLN